MAHKLAAFTGRRLGTFLAAAASLLLILAFYLTYLATKSDLQLDLQQRHKAVLDRASATVMSYLQVADRDVRFLSRSNILRQTLLAHPDSDWSSLEGEWLSLMQSRTDIYDQLRFIDSGGQERVRINNLNLEPQIAPRTALQSKVDRYYVEESRNLSVGAIYLSAFDLNVERGQIELPLKPTLRILTPVADSKGEKRGVVVLNYKGADMLRAIGDVAQAWDQELWLVNNAGYWLKGPSAAKEWGFMYPGRPAAQIKDRFPQLWSRLSGGADTGLIQLLESGYLLSSIPVSPVEAFANSGDVVLSQDEGWSLVTAFSQQSLEAQSWAILEDMIPAFLLVELLLVGLSLWAGLQIRLRLQANREIEARERQLTIMFESAPDATLMSNSQGVITRANARVEKLFGYKPEELIGQSIDLLVPDRIHTSHAALRSLYYRAPSPRSVLSRSLLTARCKDGTEVPVSVALNSLMIDGDMQVLSAVRDMTDEQQANAEIVTLNQRLEIATQAAKIGIWEYDARDGSLTWDRQMYLHYGLTGEVAITLEAWLSMIDENNGALINRQLRQTILDGAAFDVVVQAQKSHGDERWLRLIATSKLDSDGFTQILIGTELDVTAEVRIERELRRAYEKTAESNVELEALNKALEQARSSAEVGARVKSDFLANMSHEIRTPLNAVLGINHLLERQVESQTARDLVNKQNRAAQSLLGIINDILDYSKIESGKLELEQSPFSLMELLDNLATMVGKEAFEKGLNLVIVPPPIEYCGVIGDYLRLEQVLVNLCSNAIKFTEQGEVRVSFDFLSSDESKLNLRFTVRDTGVGISDSVQAQLFTPFTQADASVSRRYGGSGLGLSIAANLVKLMGGEISLSSEVGEGSSFSFVLSLSRQAIDRMSLTGLAGRRVILGCWNAALAEGLEIQFATFGTHVGRISDPEAAIERVKDEALLQTPETILVLDAAPYLPPDLQSILRPIARLPDNRQPTIILMQTTVESLEYDYTDVFQGAVVLQYPVGPLALYKAVAVKAEAVVVKPVAEQMRLAGSRLLVVDDNKINLDVAKMMLEEEGARVFLAEDGAQALNVLKSASVRVDAVLMDVQMPGMDGLEATRQIRADQKLSNLPVLALTAGVTPAQRAAAIAAGMNGFITKPIDMDRVVSLLKAVMFGGQLSFDTSSKQEVVEPMVPTEKAMPIVLNEEYGLRVFKTREKYQRYLHLFVQMYADSLVQIEPLLEDPAALRSLVHKMRGGAGHLGIDVVSRLCGELENLIDEEKPFAQTLERLKLALHEACDHIKANFPIDDVLDSALEVRLDPTQLTETLQTLHTQFLNYDLDSANLTFQRIKFQLKANDRNSLQTAIDLFDSKSALAIVEQIAKQMNINLG